MWLSQIYLFVWGVGGARGVYTGTPVPMYADRGAGASSTFPLVEGGSLVPASAVLLQAT